MVEHVAFVAAVTHEHRAHRGGVEFVDAVVVDHLQPEQLHGRTAWRGLTQPMIEPPGEPGLEGAMIEMVVHAHTGYGERRRSANVSE